MAEVLASNHDNQPNRKIRRQLLKTTAVIATVLATAGVWKHFQQSGEYEKFGPTVEKPAKIDNKFRFASWNMEGKASTRYKQIGKLANQYRLDAIALQEVTRDDVVVLRKKLKAWHGVFVLADRKQHVLNGGYGNIMLTRQKPEDIRTKPLPGSSFVATATNTVAGFGQDLVTVNLGLHRTKDGLQESRAAIAETIKVEGKDIRLITGHIAGVAQNDTPELHNDQLNEFVDFIGDNITDNRPTIVCGDFNAGEDQVVPAMANLRMITIPNQKATSSSGKTIDYCAYYVADSLGLGELQVLDKPSTDHKPIVATWDFR